MKNNLNLRQQALAAAKGSPGIMMRTLEDLFAQKDQGGVDETSEVRVSFLEVYNENLRDLLAAARVQRETGSRHSNLAPEYLDLREDPVRGSFVSGVLEEVVKSPAEIMRLLHLGNRCRTTEGTAVNETSSRSHAVLQVYVERQVDPGQGQGQGQNDRQVANRRESQASQWVVGKLSLIDLAGSERAAKTQNVGGRLIEASNINRSLLALGNCINALAAQSAAGGSHPAAGERRTFVPYRDSKLTRLLKDSLGGNCKTVMIAAISPCASHYEETVNTLKYANRTKNIRVPDEIVQSGYQRNIRNGNRGRGSGHGAPGGTTDPEASAHVNEYVRIIDGLRHEIQDLKARVRQKKRALLARKVGLSVSGLQPSF